MNKVIISGNLTRDVELKYLPSGSALAQFGIASNRKIKKQDGSYADDTCFVDIKLFGRTAEVVNQFCKKGSKLLVEGKLTFESWTDQSGAKKSRLLIVGESIEFLDTKQASADQSQSSQAQAQTQQAQVPQTQTQTQAQAPQAQTQNVVDMSYPSSIPEVEIEENEIPF